MSEQDVPEVDVEVVDTEDPVKEEPKPRRRPAPREEEYEDVEIAVCTECKTEQSEKYVKNNVFYGQGRVPCQYCSAPIMYTRRSLLKQSLDGVDRQRGLT